MAAAVVVVPTTTLQRFQPLVALVEVVTAQRLETALMARMASAVAAVALVIMEEGAAEDLGL